MAYTKQVARVILHFFLMGQLKLEAVSSGLHIARMPTYGMSDPPLGSGRVPAGLLSFCSGFASPPSSCPKTGEGGKPIPDLLSAFGPATKWTTGRGHQDCKYWDKDKRADMAGGHVRSAICKISTTASETYSTSCTCSSRYSC